MITCLHLDFGEFYICIMHCLDVKNIATAAGTDGSATRLRGLAMTWDRTVVFYVKLTSDCAQEMWKLLASLLEKAGPEKVTYDLKHQLAAVLQTGDSVTGTCTWLAHAVPDVWPRW